MEGFIFLIATEMVILVGASSIYLGSKKSQERREAKLQQLFRKRSSYVKKVIVVENSEDIMGRAIFGHLSLAAVMAFLALFAYGDPEFIYWTIGVLLVFPVWYLYFRRQNDVFVATTEGIAWGINTHCIGQGGNLMWYAWGEIDRVELMSWGPTTITFYIKELDEREHITVYDPIGGVPKPKFQELVKLINEKVPPERIDLRIRE